DRQPELVEARRLPPGECPQLGVPELAVARGTAQRRCRLIRLVHDSDAFAVDLHGPVDEVRDAERHDHLATLTTNLPSTTVLIEIEADRRTDESPLIGLSPTTHDRGRW